MDYNLYIIMREEDLDKIGILEKKVNWGGESISYSPRKYMYDNKEYFISSEDNITSVLRGFVTDNLVILRVVEGLKELEWEVNKNIDNLKFNDIIRILKKICQLDKFSIIIFEDDEIVEQHIEYTNDKDISMLISSALNWELSKNIEIYCG